MKKLARQKLIVMESGVQRQQYEYDTSSIEGMFVNAPLKAKRCYQMIQWPIEIEIISYIPHLGIGLVQVIYTITKHVNQTKSLYQLI